MIKTRFAPSPTGYLHIGNIRIALFNYLFARNQFNQGRDTEFVLRIEDSDQDRSEKQFIEDIFNDLNWLGIEFDANKVIFQSQRNASYQKYLDQLIEQNLAYPCFCSKERLEQLKQEQIKQKKPPRYDRKCSNLSETEIKELRDQGIKPSYRFRLRKKEIYLNDLRHQKRQNLSNFGDFVIQKTDGQFIFLLTNIVDDIEQSITHSIRGEDHLSNSALQTAICESLGIEAPIYLHLSLITNQQGKPLSKRDGVFSIQDLKKQSYHPIAICNYLARLGNSINENNLLSLEAMANHFDLLNLAKSSAKFDISQLNFWQKKTIASLSLEELKSWLTANGQNLDQANINEKILKVIQGNLVFAEDFFDLSRIFLDQTSENSNTNQPNNLLDQESETIIFNAPVSFIKTVIEAIEKELSYEDLIEALKKETNLSGRELFIPLRLILSLQKHGPQLQDIYQSIDPSLMLNRAKYFLQLKSEAAKE